MASRNFIQPVFCPACAKVARVAVPEIGSTVSCTNCAQPILVTTGEDVFISYSSADEDIAQLLAEELHKRDVRFWLAPHFIDHGESFLEVIEPAVRRAAVVVPLLTENAAQSDWVRREASLALSAKKTLMPVLFDDVVLSEGWGLLTVESQYIQSTSDRAGDAIRSLAASIAQRLGAEIAEEIRVPREPIHREPMESRGVDRSRKLFVGPQQYTREFRDVFFGRQAEVAEVIRRLEHGRIFSVVAPSGAGKSSLLAAGLEPALTSAGWQVISGARVGHPPDHELAFPFSSVANVFTFSAMRAISESTEGIDEVRRGRTAQRSLARCLELYPVRPRGKRLLILDQFEEIFTQYRHRHEHRAAFVSQLEDALRADPELHVLIAMRQEYVVDLNHLMESVDPEYRPERFELRRLSNDALQVVISDIAAPQARFAPGVAERIVSELNTIHVIGEDGKVESKPGEFVELVHLQIVCQQLWETLESGQKEVTNADLDRAAQRAGQDFDKFVRGALNEFYATTVASVASNASNSEPRVGDDQGMAPPSDEVCAYPEELIKLWCRKFVTREHTRRQIPEGKDHTGRLPNWIIKQLADRYLFRLDTAGSGRYYELSHDLLAPVVASESDPRVDKLLFAAELLEKRLEGTMSTPGTGLFGWFEEADELLSQCSVFLDAKGGLLEQENELLLRASLRSGKDLRGWSKRVREDAPALHQRVVAEAMRIGDDLVRAHTTELIASTDDESLHAMLADLVVEEQTPAVRLAAAKSLLRLNNEDLLRRVVKRYTKQGSEDARRAVALLLALSDELPESAFHEVYDEMRGAARRSARKLAWKIRFREALRILPSILIVTAAFAGGLAACYKWIPGIFNWALVQASPGAFMGIFHGLIAGTIWGGGISAGVAIHRLVFFRARMRTGIFRPFGAIASGAAAGVISSILVVLVITNTYETDSLANMGWIGSRMVESDRADGSRSEVESSAADPAGPIEAAGVHRSAAATDSEVGALERPKMVVDTPTRPSREFYADLFVHTRMGWAHIILGTFIGVGIAATTNSVRASPRWEAFLDRQSAFDGIGQIVFATGTIGRLVLRHLWPAIIIQSIGGVLVFFILKPGPGAIGLNSRPLYGIVGDASTQIVGTLGAVVGLGVVTIIIRHGMIIRPRSTAR